MRATIGIGLAVLVVNAARSPAGAQLQTTRGLILSTAPGARAPNHFLSRSDFFVDLQHSGARRSDAAAWNYKLGVNLQLFRLGESITLEGLLGHELYATPNNSIGFDPSGTVWEERLGLKWQRPSGTIRLELFQRCRHEVDNGTPRSESVDTTEGTPTSRVVTLGGLRLTTNTREVSRGRWSARAQLEVEGYTAASDVRSPIDATGPLWDDALAMASATALVRASLGAGRAVSLRAWGSGMRFRSIGTARSWHPSGRAELAFLAGGRGRSGFTVFLAREHVFDDAMRPVPRRFVGSFVGIRLTSAGVE